MRSTEGASLKGMTLLSTESKFFPLRVAPVSMEKPISMPRTGSASKHLKLLTFLDQRLREKYIWRLNVMLTISSRLTTPD